MSLLLSPLLKYVCGGLLFVCLMLGLALHVERVHAHKLERRVTELSATLKRITTAKDTQHTVTKTNIVTVTKTIHDADGKARKVETAPLPGNCRTPSAVLQADL